MEDYTNRELYLLLESIKLKMDEVCDQVKKTNGRVKSLELWRALIIGGFSVITLVILPYLFIIIKSAQ
jgi:hypothetical protein